MPVPVWSNGTDMTERHSDWTREMYYNVTSPCTEKPIGIKPALLRDKILLLTYIATHP